MVHAHQVRPAVRPAVADAAGECDGGGGEELLDAVAVEVGEAARQAQVHQRDVVVQGPQAVPCNKVSDLETNISIWTRNGVYSGRAGQNSQAKAETIIQFPRRKCS